MNDETKANLTASLGTALKELGQVATDVSGLITDKEIEQCAETLDHVGDSAHGGAAILRAALDARHRSRPPLPRRVRRDTGDAHRISSGPAGDAS